MCDAFDFCWQRQGIDRTFAKLINNVHYQQALKDVIRVSPEIVGYDDALKRTTPQLYSKLSAVIHDYRTRYLLVGPKTSGTEVIVLQAMINFAGMSAKVEVLRYGHDLTSMQSAVDQMSAADSDSGEPDSDNERDARAAERRL
jgi:hypothetical protein